MKKKNSLSLTMTAVVVLCAVVVLITGLIGFVLSSQSSDALRTLINQRMLDISNTAADMLDGDALAGLTAKDVDTPAYKEGMRILRTFYDNIEFTVSTTAETACTFSASIRPTIRAPLRIRSLRRRRW